ncbi:hypothetical protein DM02DRAFT_690064 [Periconia macrospinosa]|uniref:N-acetyltransferase domain-containing protein n=1 Tax=Periconia macrospinosa TaxID=97972 RepID=A0A2V1DBI1_9PLEO|nr:hypothetical protein DM02DRAFT_690064 [Periconia macrospinosa]
MSIPGHTILSPTDEDIPVLAKYLQASKLTLDINRFLWLDWPNKAAQHDDYTRAIKESFQNPEVAPFKVIHDDSGEIVAHLSLTQMNHEKAVQPTADEEPKPVPRGINPEVYATVHRTAGELNKHWEGKEHLRLTWIYVRPESRKNGIGTALVNMALQKAREQGVPLVALSEPGAREFFLKVGLKDIVHADVDLNQWASGKGEYKAF